MARKQLFLLVLLGFTTADLPPFIKPCSRTSPWLQYCIIKQVPKVIEALRRGYPPMGFKPIDPLYVENMNIPLHRNIQLSLNNFLVKGLSRANFELLVVDPFRNVLEARVRFPQISVQGFYRMKGMLFFVDVDSQGPAAITFVDVLLEARIHFKAVKRDDETFYEMPVWPVPGRDMNLEMSKANLYFGDLVPDDPVLTDELNAIIRRSFFPTFDNIRPGIVTVMWQLARIITTPLLVQTSMDDMFTD